MSAAKGRSQASSHRSPQGEGGPVSAAKVRSLVLWRRSPPDDSAPAGAAPGAGHAGAQTESSSSSEAGPPAVETLLNAAHHELADLQTSCRAFTRHGLAADALPHADTLMALALLGEHGRAQVEAELAEHWAGLQEKGLVHGDMAAYSAPRLRLLYLVQPATATLAGLRLRMASDPALPAPPEVFRCATLVADLMWGQPVRLDYQIDHTDYLLIEPGRAFRRLPVLIHTGGGAGHGNIELPGDEGEVVFTALGSDGQLYRHSTVFELRDEDWLSRSVA